MRTLVKVTIPNAQGNAAIKNGTLPQAIGRALDTLKPEAAYFITEDGKRTMLMVIDMENSSDTPKVAEPFFMAFDADVSFTPAMNAADLKVGLSQLPK